MSTVIDKAKFEEKLIEADFQFVWNQLANMEWHSLKDACEYAYRAGRVAGKPKDSPQKKESNK